MKYLALTLLAIFFISFVSATIENYPLNQEVNLILTCSVNNAIPSNSAIMNLTISYPNGSIMLDNVATTAKGNGIFNYTTTFPIAGDFKPVLMCIDGEESNSNSDHTYHISKSGSGSIREGEGSLIIVIVVSLILLSFLCFWFSTILRSPGIRVPLIFMGILFIFFSIGIILNVTIEYLGTVNSLVSNYSSLYILVTILIGAGGIGLIVFIIWFVLRAFNKSRGLVEDD